MRKAGSTMSRTPLSEEEKRFFERLGERLSTLRRERELTQAQLAEALGVTQQRIQSFEKGNRRMPVSVLPDLVEVLDASYEDLLGSRGARTKRGPPSKLERHLKQVSKLPPSQQRVVLKMLDGVLQQG